MANAKLSSTSLRIEDAPLAGTGLSTEDAEVASTASGMVTSLMMLFSGLSLYCQVAWLGVSFALIEKTWLVSLLASTREACLVERRGTGMAVSDAGTKSGW